MSDAPRILDLNAVVAPDIFVELGQDENGRPKRYPFPGDAPMEDLLRLMVKANAVDTFEGSPEDLLAMREDLGEDVDDLFRLRTPDLDEDEIHLSDGQLGELLVGLMRIYSEALSAAADGGDEGGARPTSTRRSSKNGKRSPTSSGRSRRKRPARSASSTSSPT
jgi:hypothetical protein